MEMKKLKKLGVMGGMGPKASSLYYDSIIEHTKAEKDQDHINMVILSHASMPDRTKAIFSGESSHITELLREDARTLEAMGVSNIAITCNTSHYFYDRIQSAVSIPIINMVTETVAYAIDNLDHVKKIGIMATDGTIASKIYHNACIEAGVVPVNLSDRNQQGVMSVIYDDIKCGLPGDEKKFNCAIDEFRHEECDAVILACTELSVYKENHPIPEFCLDAMDVLIRESILRSGAEYI